MSKENQTNAVHFLLSVYNSNPRVNIEDLLLDAYKIGESEGIKSSSSKAELKSLEECVGNPINNFEDIPVEKFFIATYEECSLILIKDDCSTCTVIGKAEGANVSIGCYIDSDLDELKDIQIVNDLMNALAHYVTSEEE